MTSSPSTLPVTVGSLSPVPGPEPPMPLRMSTKCTVFSNDVVVDISQNKTQLRHMGYVRGSIGNNTLHAGFLYLLNDPSKDFFPTALDQCSRHWLTRVPPVPELLHLSCAQQRSSGTDVAVLDAVLTCDRRTWIASGVRAGHRGRAVQGVPYLLPLLLLSVPSPRTVLDGA
ncbi:hypothetical protein HPB49_008000 [Dermacentor silvarum]|uniref:Uncharacterized protein n=1 Tax=Dermacentor silvarum TaxID=543639 RepID=A0ACB8CWB5_DERSI|nr:hypothetical protein HPB49_008000 [Dermacentor silvarum]